MRDAVLWRKISHITILLAETLQIDVERALDLFYSTDTTITIYLFHFIPP